MVEAGVLAAELAAEGLVARCPVGWSAVEWAAVLAKRLATARGFAAEQEVGQVRPVAVGLIRDVAGATAGLERSQDSSAVARE